MLELRDILGVADIVMITFDALRFDVATQAFRAGATPFLSSIIPNGWEKRHSPGNFTFAAHAAFFAGFWPTAVGDSASERPFALEFTGAKSVGPRTCALKGNTIVDGLQQRGYKTICIGGVGFFNKLNPLGSQFPNLFSESYWEPAFGVAELHSTREQIRCAVDKLRSTSQPIFLFINLSATHQPTRMYLPGAKNESTETQTAALAYVDRQLPALFDALTLRGRPGYGFLMSDHGTLFGEEGMHGHRVGHESVWTVPYAECDWGIKQ